MTSDQTPAGPDFSKGVALSDLPSAEVERRDAERMGQAAALAILGRLPRFEDVPFFWSAHYDVTINYVGHAESWDRLDVHGDLAARDATVAYRMGGRTLAVATVGRDRTSLEAEAAFERNDQTALAAFGVSR